MAVQIKSLEREKAALQLKIDEAREILTESDIRFANLKERIIRQAEKEKEKILQAADEQSRLMLNNAKQRVKNRIQQAKTAFMAELVDTAIAAAIEKLPKLITREDDEKFLDRFMTEVETT